MVQSKSLNTTSRFLGLAAGVLFFHLLVSVITEAVFIRANPEGNIVLMSFLQVTFVAFFAFLDFKKKLANARSSVINKKGTGACFDRHSEPITLVCDKVPSPVSLSENGIKDEIVDSPIIITSTLAPPSSETGYNIASKSLNKTQNFFSDVSSPDFPWAPQGSRITEIYKKINRCSLPFGLLHKVPLTTYAFIAAFSTGSVILTNTASHLLNYPTQVVFKSSKLLFVMVLRTFFGMGKHKTKQHVRIEYCCCFIIVSGLVFFTSGTAVSKYFANKNMSTDGASQAIGVTTFLQSIVSGTSSTTIFYGILSIIIALVCDALVYILQEKYCFQQCGAESSEVIFFVYTFSTLFSLLSVVSTEGLLTGFLYIYENPQMFFLIMTFSICNFFGTRCLLQLVSEFDSNTAVIVTCMRKTCTVLLSFMIYPKPFTWMHVVGLILVSFGIYIFESARIKFKNKAEMEKSFKKEG